MNQPQANKTTSMGGDANKNLARPNITTPPPTYKPINSSPSHQGMTTTSASKHAPASTTPSNAPLTFSSSNIAGTKASNSRDYFTEQNLKTQQKKAQSQKNRQRAIKYSLLAFGALVLVGGIVTGAVIWYQNTRPEDIDVAELEQKQQEELVSENGNYVPGSNAANTIQGEANTIINDGGNHLDLEDFYDEKIESTSDTAERINMSLLAMTTYYQQNLPESVISLGLTLNPDEMTVTQIGTYGGLMYSAYVSTGNPDLAQKYYQLSVDRGPKPGGGGAQIVNSVDEE